MMHMGDIMSTVRGIMSTVGGVQYSSLQWTTWTPYGTSYMYGTHHFNNYYHNSKSISIMWGLI